MSKQKNQKMADDEAVQLLFFDTFPHEVNEVKLFSIDRIVHYFEAYVIDTLLAHGTLNFHETFH